MLKKGGGVYAYSYWGNSKLYMLNGRWLSGFYFFYSENGKKGDEKRRVSDFL